MGARLMASGVAAMLRWAFGYLAMAIVVAIGFASLQDSDRSEGRSVSAAAKHGTKSARSVRAYQDEVEHESAWEDEGYAEDEAYPEDQGYPEDEGDLEYVVQAGAGGHYVVEAVVNGAPVTFLVDTGASNIVLTMEDAERLGLHPATLHFTQRFATANGETRGAPVLLREIRIGQFSLFDVAASVNEAPLRVSLLGMSFLRRLNGYEVDDGRLILRW
jgi:clan AA aspartic protease (TIGR02281 family)